MTYPTYVLCWSLSPLLRCGADTDRGAWLSDTVWPRGAGLVWLQWHVSVALTLRAGVTRIPCGERILYAGNSLLLQQCAGLAGEVLQL